MGGVFSAKNFHAVEAAIKFRASACGFFVFAGAWCLPGRGVWIRMAGNVRRVGISVFCDTRTDGRQWQSLYFKTLDTIRTIEI